MVFQFYCLQYIHSKDEDSEIILKKIVFVVCGILGFLCVVFVCSIMLRDSDAGDSQRGRDSHSQLQATPPLPKRKRTSKASNTQFEELLVKLEARPYLATRRFTGLQGRENFEVGWKELAQDLNQSHNGAVKTPEQWMTVWRDLKSRCCSKAAKYNKEKVQTGNRGVNTPPLTEIEKRVISLVGIDYTVGTNCPDAMPEEDAVQRDLEAGVILDSFISNSNLQVKFEGQTNTSIIADPVKTNDATSTQAETSYQPLQAVLMDMEPTTPKQAVNNNKNPGESRQRNQPRRDRVLNPRRSIVEQHNSARTDFLVVAELNADAMKVLAAATKLHAEAAKIQAEAAKTQAEALMLFAEAANKVCDILKENFKK